MPKVFTSEKQKIGELGENIAAKFLVKHGFLILDRNYTKKWGEIDIVAEKEGKLYFIEVKSVSRETLDTFTPKSYSSSDDRYEPRPEDNMHPWKLKRLSRTIQTYLLSHRNLEEKEWQVDLLVIYLCQKERKARVKVVSDIIL
ncbi:YraN family protein [Candidatus Nomurabacteria bacterium]|nr:YraN family protein [Candidatus Nomurabacteria bacterium]